jgi:hypothetical protein
MSDLGERFLALVSLLVVGLAVASLVMPSPAFAQLGEIPRNNTQKMGQMAPGTVNLHDAAVEFLNENLNATLFDALDAAEKQVTNGTAIEAHLNAVQGYLVYNVTVANLNNELFYTVYIDMSGQVLAVSSPGKPLFSLGAKGNSENFVNVNASMVDAADAAEAQIQNGTAIAGSFEVIPGLNNPMYSITVFGFDSGKFFRIYVDPATAKVLYLPEELHLGDLHVQGVF